jgi:Flp pilus assembly protein TadB
LVLFILYIAIESIHPPAESTRRRRRRRQNRKLRKREKDKKEEEEERKATQRRQRCRRRKEKEVRRRNKLGTKERKELAFTYTIFFISCCLWLLFVFCAGDVCLLFFSRVVILVKGWLMNCHFPDTLYSNEFK